MSRLALQAGFLPEPARGLPINRSCRLVAARLLARRKRRFSLISKLYHIKLKPKSKIAKKNCLASIPCIQIQDSESSDERCRSLIEWSYIIHFGVFLTSYYATQGLGPIFSSAPLEPNTIIPVELQWNRPSCFPARSSRRKLNKNSYSPYNTLCPGKKQSQLLFILVSLSRSQML